MSNPKGAIRGRQPMTLKARVKKLCSALDRSARYFDAMSRDEKQEPRARIVMKGHTSAYALVVGFLKTYEEMSEAEIGELLKSLIETCATYAARELPEEPESVEGEVEDEQQALARWVLQGQLATYKQMRLQLENVLTEHGKAIQKHARKTH